MTTEPLLSVRDVSVEASTHGQAQPIVRGVSFDLHGGEALGIVGESGSGKSLTLRAVRRTLPENVTMTGTVTMEGRSITDLGASQLRAWHTTDVAMIYQDPRAAINPVRRIGDFLTESLVRRISKSEAAERAIRQLRAVGIKDAERRMGQYPHELSGGLLQRVMIAAALLDEPKLIMADEPTTALDVTTQEEVMAIIDELRRERGLALILVTHDLDLAAAVSDRIATMYAGSLVEVGPSERLHDTALHPYTVGLLASRPSVTEVAELQAIEGRPISAAEVTTGCAFAPRCPLRIEICDRSTPALSTVGDRLVACHVVSGRAESSASEPLRGGNHG